MPGAKDLAALVKRLRQIKAGDLVSRLKVREGTIPNMSSISASLNEWDEVPGLMEIPFAELSGPAPATDRVRDLMEQIRASGEIDPLISVLDDQGLYILEGAHRFDALQHLGHETYPSKLVIDRELLPDFEYAGGGKVAKKDDDDVDVVVDPRTGRLHYIPRLKPIPGIKKLKNVSPLKGLPLPASVRRAAEDWTAESEPTVIGPNGRVSGGPGALDALSALDVPFQAMGEEIFERTGSPAAATAAYAVPGFVSPRQVGRAGRKAAKVIKEKAPDVVRGALERLGPVGDVMDPRMFAVKERGGQWIEPDLSGLLPLQGGAPTPGEKAISDYVNKNLRRWMKTSMGTKETDDLAQELGLDPATFDYPITTVDVGSVQQFAKPFFDADKVATSTELRNALKLARLTPSAQLARENPWLMNLDPATEVFELRDIAGAPAYPDELKEMLDYARTLPPDRIKNISVPDMLRQSKAWHDALAAKQAETARTAGHLKTMREYPEGFKWVEIGEPDVSGITLENLPQGYKLHKGQLPDEAWGIGPETGPMDASRDFFETPEAALEGFRKSFARKQLEAGLNAEGEMMGHCVGAYCDQVQKGTRIFSLRDPQGMSHVTIEAGAQAPETIGDIKRMLGDEWEDFLQEQYGTDPQKLAEGRAFWSGDDTVVGRHRGAEIMGARPHLKASLPLQIRQIKGKQNAPPVEKYRSYVQDLIRNPFDVGWGRIDELENAGMLEHGGRYWTKPELIGSVRQHGRVGGQSFADYMKDELDRGWNEEEAAEQFMRDVLLQGEFNPPFAGGGKVATAAKVAEENARSLLKMLRQSVKNPQRKDYPGIYKHPAQLAAEAEAQVAPESLALSRLFGVTRSDLASIARRKGNRPAALPGAAKNPKGSAAVSNIITSANTRRIVGALELAQEQAPELTKGMTGWYVMDPLYQRMEALFGPEEARRRYEQFNTLVGMASPSSDVLTEINRGTAANMMATQGRFGEFLEHGGRAAAARGADFPEDLRAVKGHAYHGTAQAPAMQKFLETGEIQSAEPKVPLYIQASGVPEIGFQTDTPVPDAHFVRGIGLADTRTQLDAPGSSASMAELQALTPWWREEVAGQAGLEAVPGQALAWGLFSPQTGVRTKIGAPKLELLAIQVEKAAERMGTDPQTALNRILEGKAHAGFIDPELAAGIAAVGGGAVLGKYLESKGYADGGKVREEGEFAQGGAVEASTMAPDAVSFLAEWLHQRAA